MLLRERMSQFLFRNVRIHATDVDGQFGSQVVSGVFPEEQLRRIPPHFLRRYFRQTDQQGWLQVVAEVRSRIDFSRHDLLSLTPIRQDLSLIVCKNVLLHFDEHQRCDVLRMFHGALRKDGLLVMEHTQKVPRALQPLLQQAAPHAQVYRRIDPAAAKAGRGNSGAARRVDGPVDMPAPQRGSKPHVSASD
jgi:chemotaxis protein methyltransferase CheR